MRRIVIGLISVVGVVGCGISNEKYQSALDELTKCKKDHDACVAERDTGQAKMAELQKHVAELEAQVQGTEKSLGEAQSSASASKKELEELRKQHAQAEARLAAFQKLTARFQKMIDAGKIKVKIRNGQMVMQLPAGILFASGRADLSKDGQAAITEVADILKEFNDRRFLIAGHTDNRPLGHGDRYRDNWELSAARAVTVTKFLVSHGVSANNLVAAGYGEFDPVGDNQSDEGRQENRRIEIVLLPNIEEMPAMPKEAAWN
jgi:chemotaxis protein MotB